MGLIAYEGPSRIDNKPIVVIVTGEKGDTANEKTGPMAQTWILRSDISPNVAIHTGEDVSICGSCPLRGIIQKNEDGSTKNMGRSCYVTVRNAPLAVWNAWQRGSYAEIGQQAWKDIKTRLGSYGDPAAIPFKILKNLIDKGSGKWTGYTHQWRIKKFQALRKLVMASTSSVEETKLAWKKGWRTFRIRKAGEPLLPGEIECPASEEGGKRRTCDTCGACNGIGLNMSRQNAVSVSIVVHGTKAALLNYEKFAV
jgi:hypothetical protein